MTNRVENLNFIWKQEYLAIRIWLNITFDDFGLQIWRKKNNRKFASSVAMVTELLVVIILWPTLIFLEYDISTRCFLFFYVVSRIGLVSNNDYWNSNINYKKYNQATTFYFL